MKKLMFGVICAMVTAVCAEEVSQNAAETAAVSQADKNARYWSGVFKMTPEEWKKLPPEVRQERAKAYNNAIVDKRAKIWAKKCNMTVEEWKKLTPDQQTEENSGPGCRR